MKTLKILDTVSRKPGKRSPATDQQPWLGTNKDGHNRLVLQTGLGPIDFAVTQMENGDFVAIGEPFGDTLCNPAILEEAFAAASKVLEEHGSKEFVFKTTPTKGSGGGNDSYKNPSKAMFAFWLRGHLKFLDWSIGPKASEHDTPKHIAHQAFRAGFLYAHMLLHEYEQFAAMGQLTWEATTKRRPNTQNPVWDWLESEHPDWRRMPPKKAYKLAKDSRIVGAMSEVSFTRKFREKKKSGR